MKRKNEFVLTEEKRHDIYVRDYLRDWYGKFIRLCNSHYIVKERGAYYYMPDTFFAEEKNYIEADEITQDGNYIVIVKGKNKRRVRKDEFLKELQSRE